MHHQISRIMIESAIDKGLSDLQIDLKRSVRNLVDLGDYFAKGRFQKDFFRISQQILSNNNSPYYELIDNIVNNVDHSILKKFGINLGLNSWTNGAQRIREFKKENQFNIPWTIIFDFHEQYKNPLNISEIIDIIKQGKEMGIYTYLFFSNNDPISLNKILEVCKQNLDCAFIIYTYAELVTKSLSEKIKKCGNVIISIQIDKIYLDAEFSDRIDLLHKEKCLFGVHFYFDSNNANSILDNSLIKQIVKLNCIFLFLIKTENCEQKTEQAIKSYSRDSKTNLKSPIFLIDFFEDISHVGNNISENSCLLKILGDGTVLALEKNSYTKSQIRKSSLIKVLSQIMPKVEYQ